MTKRIIAASAALAIAIGSAQAQAPTVPHLTILHSFGSGNDGAYPEAGLVANQGALYGTTVNGGTSNNGTVFKLTPPGIGKTQWTEKVLYRFLGSTDGQYPYAVPIGHQGALYGTTNGGGGNGCNAGLGCGVVFKLRP
jgi:uncharacterized repeat protein (TIGR03803 family)